MSVKICPDCGTEYVASATVCADDGAELLLSEPEEMEGEVAEEVAIAEDRAKAGLDPDEADISETAGEQVAYELDDWDNASRIMLDQLLNGDGIVHVWEAATLVIRAEDEDAVDVLVEQVEVTNQPTLDPEKEQVVYELEAWPEEQRDALMAALDEAEIPFGFDENNDLVVHEEDQDRVDPVLDQIDFNFSLDGDEIAEGDDEADEEGTEEDGLATQEMLSELFVAADRLLNKPRDKDGRAGLIAGNEAVAALKLPYGFAPGVWADIGTRAAGLSELLQSEEADDEAVREAARELRELLHQFV